MSGPKISHPQKGIKSIDSDESLQRQGSAAFGDIFAKNMKDYFGAFHEQLS